MREGRLISKPITTMVLTKKKQGAASPLRIILDAVRNESSSLNELDLRINNGFLEVCKQKHQPTTTVDLASCQVLGVA